MHRKIKQILSGFALCVTLVLPTIAHADAVKETPSALAMAGDTIFVRPVMLATTIIGAGLFIVSSPFSALGGNIGESFEVLVEGPFETTFVRCLGCTMNGRKVTTVVEQDESSKDAAE